MEFSFLFPMERWAATSGDNIQMEIETRIIQIIEKRFTSVHQTRTFPSESADASNRPSGEKATDRTLTECPEIFRGFVSTPFTCRSQNDISFSQPLHKN
jgi:hypothetical protein